MRILVFGAAGMLGHMLMLTLGQYQRYDVRGTVRSKIPPVSLLYPHRSSIFENIDIRKSDDVDRVLDAVRPDVVINAIVLRSMEHPSATPAAYVYANALWPHLLAEKVAASAAKLYHISSDGIFSGLEGPYKENDQPDPRDIYGASKFVGEPSGKHCVSLRTSIIGPEIGTGSGLLTWFINQPSPKVTAYKNWIFSGVTTLELSRIFAEFILPHNDLEGIFHVASTPVSRWELLTLIKEIYSLPVELIPDEAIVRDRTLDARKFNKATGYTPPGWRQMIQDLKEFQDCA